MKEQTLETSLHVAELSRCPACGADWQGDEIPATHREHFGGKTHYRRLIAVYDRDKDRTVAWRCPDCKEEWPRDAMVFEAVRNKSGDVKP